MVDEAFVNGKVYIKGSGKVVYIKMIELEARPNGLFLLIIVLHGVNTAAWCLYYYFI